MKKIIYAVTADDTRDSNPIIGNGIHTDKIKLNSMGKSFICCLGIEQVVL